MKTLKKIVTVLFGLAIFLLLQVLSFSLIAKNFIQKQIIDGILKDEIIDDYLENSDKSKVDELKKILDDDDLNDIINNIIDEFVKALDDENYEVSDKTVDKIVDFCVKNKDKISEVTGKEVDEKKLISDSSKEELREALNSSLNEVTNEIDSTIKVVIKVYKCLTSTIAILLISLAILAISGVAMIINGNIASGLNTLGIPAIVNGVLLIILYAIITALLKNITINDSKVISIRPTIIMILGFVIMIIGMASILLKNYLKKDKTTQPVVNNN